MKLAFEIDTRDMYGTTSMTVSFFGRQTCAAFLLVKSVKQVSGKLLLDCTPIALCEAAAYGIPVIASDVGGVSTIVTEGNGRLMPPGSSADDYTTAVLDLVRDAMSQMGVPVSAIVTGDVIVDNTAAEAEMLRSMAERRHWRTVIVVTSKYHTRRAGFALRRTLLGSGVEIVMRATRYDMSDPDNWWRRRGDFRRAARFQKLAGRLHVRAVELRAAGKDPSAPSGAASAAPRRSARRASSRRARSPGRRTSNDPP